ncbi:MAG: chromate efflux transporter [Verrucomicrobia bacterium]|nr:chromate efflux transporter [Verrucomicrobiota bacterium]MBS0636748.1 chromate efflux transporter [Verrucomicrobiota bacterium]
MYTIWDLARYFLWLGTFGFGGPIALIGYMQRDLVEKKGWLTHDDYVHGLALAQMCPGPLATYLALYFGWLKARVFGATIIAVAFLLPSFLLVIALALFYISHSDVSWVVSAFYGIGASIIAIIFRSACKLAKITCRNEKLLWTLFGTSALLAPFVTTKVVFLLLASGLIAMFIKAPPRIGQMHAIPFAWLTTGLHGEATGATLAKIGLYFVWAGSFVFGSGLAIIPLLEPGVVQEYQWLTTSQFLDAVSVGLITPGPALITSAFIGYLVAGFLGACVALIAVFLPCYLCVIILAPLYTKIRKNHSARAFISGISAAASGVILGAAFVLGKQAICDATTVILCLTATAIIFLVKKIPEPFIIFAAGIVGVLVK